MNAVEIEAAISDLALEPSFDAAEFPYAFLAAFGNKDTTQNYVAVFAAMCTLPLVTTMI